MTVSPSAVAPNNSDRCEMDLSPGTRARQGGLDHIPQGFVGGGFIHHSHQHRFELLRAHKAAGLGREHQRLRLGSEQPQEAGHPQAIAVGQGQIEDQGIWAEFATGFKAGTPAAFCRAAAGT